MARRNSSTRKSPVKPATMPDPAGRVDIALCRLLEESVRQFGSPQVQKIYADLASPINESIRTIVGPRTDIGVTAKRAVNVIQLVVGELAGGGNVRRPA